MPINSNDAVIYDRSARKIVEVHSDWRRAHKRRFVLEPAPSLYEPGNLRNAYRYAICRGDELTKYGIQ